MKSEINAITDWINNKSAQLKQTLHLHWQFKEPISDPYQFTFGFSLSNQNRMWFSKFFCHHSTGIAVYEYRIVVKSDLLISMVV